LAQNPPPGPGTDSNAPTNPEGQNDGGRAGNGKRRTREKMKKRDR
jgi:hypothetical protein